VPIELGIDTCQVEHAWEASWIAPDPLKIVVKSHFNSIFLLHCETFTEPELSILESHLHDLLVLRLNLLDAQFALLKLFGLEELLFFALYHF
jgi:hypothetical protein